MSTTQTGTGGNSQTGAQQNQPQICPFYGNLPNANPSGIPPIPLCCNPFQQIPQCQTFKFANIENKQPKICNIIPEAPYTESFVLVNLPMLLFSILTAIPRYFFCLLYDFALIIYALSKDANRAIESILDLLLAFFLGIAEGASVGGCIVISYIFSFFGVHLNIKPNYNICPYKYTFNTGVQTTLTEIGFALGVPFGLINLLIGLLADIAGIFGCFLTNLTIGFCVGFSIPLGFTSINISFSQKFSPFTFLGGLIPFNCGCILGQLGVCPYLGINLGCSAGQNTCAVTNSNCPNLAKATTSVSQCQTSLSTCENAVSTYQSNQLSQISTQTSQCISTCSTNYSTCLSQASTCESTCISNCTVNCATSCSEQYAPVLSNCNSGCQNCYQNCLSGCQNTFSQCSTECSTNQSTCDNDALNEYNSCVASCDSDSCKTQCLTTYIQNLQSCDATYEQCFSKCTNNESQCETGCANSLTTCVTSCSTSVSSSIATCVDNCQYAVNQCVSGCVQKYNTSVSQCSTTHSTCESTCESTNASEISTLNSNVNSSISTCQSQFNECISGS